MDKLLPEYADEVRQSLIGQKKEAWLAYIPRVIGMTGLLGTVTIGMYLAAPEWLIYELVTAGVVMLFYLLCVVLGFFVKKIATEGDCLIASSGCFEIRSICVPYHNIQYFAMQNGPVMAHYNQCRGEIHVLASALESVYPIGYFDKTVMEEIHHKMLSAE